MFHSHRSQKRQLRSHSWDAVEKIVETPEIQDRIQQRNVEQIINTPVLPVEEELAEISKAFSQNRAQQRFGGQIVESPAVSLTEKTVEMPDTRTQDKTQHVVNTHVQHVVNAVETEMSKIIKETLQRKKPIINEKINQVTKHAEIPQLQIVEKTTETSKIQTIQGTRTSESLGTAPVCQMAQAGHVEVKSRTRSRDCGNGRPARTHEDMKEYSRSADRPKAQMSTSIVQRLKSKFEVEEKRSQVPTVQRVQKTVEVPRVQCIDKVADISVDMQRQVSTLQAGQHIEEVEDVPALTQSEVPNIPDDDEDQLEQENRKRRLPTPTEAVSESRADESDFDRFDDLVLPSPEGKTSS